MSTADALEPDDAASGRGATPWLLGGAGLVAAIAVVVAIVVTSGDDDDDASPAGSSATTATTEPGSTTEPDEPTATPEPTPTTTATGPTATTAPTASTVPDEPTATTGPTATSEPGSTATTSPTATTEPDDPPTPVADPTALMFQNAAVGGAYGLVATAPLGAPNDERVATGLRCDRLDFQSGRGVCARTNRGVETIHEAVVFDESFAEGYRVGLLGPPSRVKVSPSGNVAAVTSFVAGHEYESDDFSTQTILIDLVGERVTADLEADFEVRRDGEVWSEEDFNFWGVTFVDDDRLYATLGTGGSHYLVEGEVSTGVLQVVHDNGQCPSLSPNGDRIAFRTRVEADDQQTWRLAVLDLATGDVDVLAEDRNVDDQPTWIGASTVAYGLTDPESPAEPDIWSLPADGSGEPQLLAASAWSIVALP